MQESRRAFLKGSLVIGGLGLLNSTLAFETDDRANLDFTIVAGPYLQSNFTDNMVIQWITNKEAFGWVEYGLDKNDLNQTAYGQAKYGLRSVGRLHNVQLVDLKPGQTYYYRIVSKEIKDFQPYKLAYGAEVYAPIETFTAIDTSRKDVSFIMMNDIHDRPQSIAHLLALDEEQKRDFIFFNGDIFDYQEDESQIVRNFLTPVVDLFAKHTPFLYVRGNHETRGKFARSFSDYFYQIGYQAFTLGPVRFVVLDSGEDKSDAHPVYGSIVDYNGYRLQQARLLANEIKSPAFKKAQFRVVLMHMPPIRSGEEWHGSNHAVEVFEPLMNKGQVDLVLSGHIHRSKVHEPAPGANSYPIITGGGPKDGGRTLIKVKADAHRLVVEILDDKGGTLDTLTIPSK